MARMVRWKSTCISCRDSGRDRFPALAGSDPPKFVKPILSSRQGNRIWSLRLLKAGSTSWGSGAVNSDRGCRNAEEPASVRSFARRKGSSAVNHLPDFSYAIALDSRNVAIKCAKVQTLVKDGQAEMVAHGLEIPIRMQQRVTTLNTKGADDHGDRLADGDALRSQQAIVRGDLRGQGGGQHGFDPVSPQC